MTASSDFKIQKEAPSMYHYCAQWSYPGPKGVQRTDAGASSIPVDRADRAILRQLRGFSLFLCPHHGPLMT
jgi:hypothetical protein